MNLNLKHSWLAGRASFLAAAVVVSALNFCPLAQADDAKVPIPVELPSPTVKGTPEDLPKGPGIEPVSDKAPPPFLAPKGVKNLALHRPVTSSVAPFTGDLNQLTDGKKEAIDTDTVEMKKGPQWVQVDLGASAPLYAIVVWHDHRYLQVIHAVIVQVSDDPEFKTGVTTLYNNDMANLAGQGVGTDKEYFETNRGRTIDAKGIKARYVRGYTKGSSSSALNCWQEIEAYGLAAQ